MITGTLDFKFFPLSESPGFAIFLKNNKFDLTIFILSVASMLLQVNYIVDTTKLYEKVCKFNDGETANLKDTEVNEDGVMRDSSNYDDLNTSGISGLSGLD